MKTQERQKLEAVGFRTWRKINKISQARLARWFIKSRQTVINWEDGSTPIDGAALAFAFAFQRLTDDMKIEVIANLDGVAEQSELLREAFIELLKTPSEPDTA